jgi:hypothetical protein
MIEVIISVVLVALTAGMVWLAWDQYGWRL